jgi:repressor LexA
MAGENDVKNIFAKNVQRLRDGGNLTQEKLGEMIGVGKTTISQWESAHKLPNAGNIEKIAEFFDVPKSALFSEGPDRFISFESIMRIPIVSKISCGNGSPAEKEIDGYEATPQDWVKGGEFFYLRVVGDSMINARIYDGDLVLIREQPDLENGDIGAVVIGSELYLKRVYKKNATLILQSENPKYTPIICDLQEKDCNVKIIGKLKKVVIDF